MKRITTLLFALSLVGGAARAQSTMPAMGVNTPKGQVARTDASINQAPADTSRSARMSTKAKKTRVHKTKMTSHSTSM